MKQSTNFIGTKSNRFISQSFADFSGTLFAVNVYLFETSPIAVINGRFAVNNFKN